MTRFTLLKKISATILLLLLVSGAVLAAVHHTTAARPEAANGRLTVVASYYPLYDFARQVGGSKVQVTNMTPAGAEPHDYEPSPQALARAQQAAVFMYNGEHFEPWAPAFLKDYKHTAIRANANLPVRGGDAHFWLDPVLAGRMVETIRQGLSRADPAHADYYASRAFAYRQQLQDLDRQFTAGLAACQQQTIITSHEAFGYVGARYHITMEPIAGFDPESEPSPAALARLAQLIRTHDLRYVTFESLVSSRLADTLATETGATALVLNPIEGLTDDEQAQGQNYLTVQQANLKAMRQALACN